MTDLDGENFGTGSAPDLTSNPSPSPGSGGGGERVVADSGTGGAFSRPYRALTLGIVSVVLLVAFEATAVGTAMPVAARKLDGLSLYAFAFSGFFTTSLLAMVISGEWADKRGPLAPLFTGIGVFGGGLLIAGTAVSMWPFVLGRAVQGLGGGLVIVALYVVVGRAVPERIRPTVFACFSASWVVPSIVGPLVSGTVTEQLGWRWVFLAIPALILLPVAVMLPPLRRFAAREREESRRQSVDAGPAGAATDATRTGVNGRRILLALAVAVGTGLLQYAGQHLDLTGLVPLLLGLALLVPSITKLLPAGTFRMARGMPAVVLSRGIAAGSFIAVESFLPLMLVEQRHLSPTMAGLSLAGGGLSWAVGSRLQALPRLGRHRPQLIQVGLLLVAVAILSCGLALVQQIPAWIVLISWTVGGLGMGMVITSLSVLLMELSRPGEAGSNAASLQVSDSLGNVLLVGLAGAIFAALHGGGAPVAEPHAGADSHAGSPTAYLVILATMTGIALVGACFAWRTRAPTDPATPAAPAGSELER